MSGTHVSPRVSLPAPGKRDTLFPFLPASLRRLIHLDAVSDFSVTDQFWARAATQLLQITTAIMMIFDGVSNDTHVFDERAFKENQQFESTEIELAAPVSQNEDSALLIEDDAPVSEVKRPPTLLHHYSEFINSKISELSQARPAPKHFIDFGLVPASCPFRFSLRCVDAMACAGGNAISLAAAFGSIDAHHSITMTAFEMCGARSRLLWSNMNVVLHSDPNHIHSAIGNPSAETAASASSSSASTYSYVSNNVSFRVFHGDGLAWLLTSSDSTSADIVFLDPPFGGQEYSKSKSPELYLNVPDSIRSIIERLNSRSNQSSASLFSEYSTTNFPLWDEITTVDHIPPPGSVEAHGIHVESKRDDSDEKVLQSSLPLQEPRQKRDKQWWAEKKRHAKEVAAQTFSSSDHDSPSSVQIDPNLVSFTDICASLSVKTHVLMLKLPKSYDTLALAKSLTDRFCSDGCLESEEFKWQLKPFCFQFQFGTVLMMLIIFPHPIINFETPPSNHHRLQLRHQHLDRLVQAYRLIDRYGFNQELDPRFFDWEKQRYISLRRWLGTSHEKAKKA